MEDAARNFPLEDIDRECLFHPNTSIADHLKKGPVIFSEAAASASRTRRARTSSTAAPAFGASTSATAAPRWPRRPRRRSRTSPIITSSAAPPTSRSSVSPNACCSFFTKKPARPTCRRCSSAPAARTPTTRTSSLSATTTTCAASRKKKKIISRMGAYHGLTYAAASLTGIPVYHKAFDLPVEGVLHASCPHYFRYGKQGESEDAYADRLVAEIEDMIKRKAPETVAAFIAEPDHGHRRRSHPAQGLFREAAERCSIGTTFCSLPTKSSPASAARATGSRPAACSSSPTSSRSPRASPVAYFPVSASVISQKIWDVLADASPEMGPVMHGFTYSGHPVGGALGLVNIDIMEREGLDRAGARRRCLLPQAAARTVSAAIALSARCAAWAR